jgi:glycosyltransferase involved in cell wall biosynthesis
VGTLEPRKNIEACIAAYRSIAPKYPGLELILAGTYGWSVRRMLRSIKDDTSIHWLQYVSDAEKTMLYKHARVLVWPSLYEGFGFPPLESLRQGTPVVTSYRTSLPEVLGINALYVHPYNVGELAAVLDQLLAEGELPSLLQQMPPRYRERTWKQVASEYVLALTAKI